jgi:hypothetical protein
MEGLEPAFYLCRCGQDIPGDPLRARWHCEAAPAFATDTLKSELSDNSIRSGIVIKPMCKAKFPAWRDVEGCTSFFRDSLLG